MNNLDPMGLDEFDFCDEEGNGFIKQKICDFLVNRSCSGPQRAVCCRAEFNECMSDAGDDKEKISECGVNYGTCSANVKKRVDDFEDDKESLLDVESEVVENEKMCSL